MNRLIHLVHGEAWSIKLKGDAMGPASDRGDSKEPWRSKGLEDVAMKVPLPKNVRFEGLASQNLDLDAHECKGWRQTSTISTHAFGGNFWVSAWSVTSVTHSVLMIGSP